MKNPDTKDGRAKRLVKFHLDISRDDDFELMGYLKTWKGKRQLLPTIRQAVWLMISLMSGSLELLMQMFPDAIKAIRSDLQTENAALRALVETQENEIAMLQKELSKRQSTQPELTPIQAQLERIEKLMLQQGKLIVQDAPNQREPETVHNDSRSTGLKTLQPIAVGSSAGPKQLNVPKFTAPPSEDEDDEDLLEVKKDETAAMRTTQNFLKSIMGLVDENKQPPKTNTTYGTSGKRRYNKEAEQQ
jgi:hypothetical protein